MSTTPRGRLGLVAGILDLDDLGHDIMSMITLHIIRTLMMILYVSASNTIHIFIHPLEPTLV